MMIPVSDVGPVVRAGWTEIGFYRPAEKLVYEALWDRFDEKFDLRPSGGRPARAIRDPSPSVTFDLTRWHSGPEWVIAAASIQAEAIEAFATTFADTEVFYVLDWKHPAYELRPVIEFAESEPFDLSSNYPSVYPNGDYYAYLTPDFGEGTFGNPWEPSLCVFGERMIGSLGRSLATWMPVLRSNGVDGWEEFRPPAAAGAP